MSILLPKNLPRYECLIEAARRYPELDPTACEAFLNLLQASNHVIHTCETFFTEQGLSQGRFAVMMQLLDKSNDWVSISRTPAELADYIGVTRATMTGLIDTLERDGLVSRTPSEDDRRMMTVQLTEKGRQTLERVLPGYFTSMARVMGPLFQSSERKALVGLLTRITQPASVVEP